MRQPWRPGTRSVRRRIARRRSRPARPRSRPSSPRSLRRRPPASARPRTRRIPIRCSWPCARRWAGSCTRRRRRVRGSSTLLARTWSISSTTSTDAGMRSTETESGSSLGSPSSRTLPAVFARASSMQPASSIGRWAPCRTRSGPWPGWSGGWPRPTRSSRSSSNRRRGCLHRGRPRPRRNSVTSAESVVVVNGNGGSCARRTPVDVAVGANLAPSPRPPLDRRFAGARRSRLRPEVPFQSDGNGTQSSTARFFLMRQAGPTGHREPTKTTHRVFLRRSPNRGGFRPVAKAAPAPSGHDRQSGWTHARMQQSGRSVRRDRHRVDGSCHANPGSCSSCAALPAERRRAPTRARSADCEIVTECR